VLSLLTVGGSDSGKLFTGTICHVAGYNSALSLSTLTQHHLASTTGFAGERSDQRIARIASWAGIPAGLQALDVGVAGQVIDQHVLGVAAQLGFTGRVVPARPEDVTVAPLQHVVGAGRSGTLDELWGRRKQSRHCLLLMGCHFSECCSFYIP